jgi:hypothetical protein
MEQIDKIPPRLLPPAGHIFPQISPCTSLKTVLEYAYL